MERLTKKYKGYYDHRLGTQWISFEDDYDEVFNKLGKLEDIEEELGIPLEVLFKALKNGIWSTVILNRLQKENKIRQFKNVSLKSFEEGWGLVDLRQNFDENLTGTLVLLKHYRDTWGLTKEEIKNEEEI